MLAVRVVFGAIGIVSLIGAVVAIFAGAPLPAILASTGIGLALTIGVIFERVHYKLLATRAPGPEWIPTEERFVDPTTGKRVQVHIKPATGERLYVDLDAASQ